MGFEVEVVAQLTDRLQLRMGGQLLEAELDSNIANAATGAVSVPEGTELPYSPEWSLAALVNYHWPLANGWSLDATANHTRQDHQATTLQNPASPVYNIPSRNQTDLRLTLSGADDVWAASLFANNVTDEDEVTLNLSSAYYPQYFAFQTPRTIGLELSYRPQRR